jgi:hypothetical protein
MVVSIPKRRVMGLLAERADVEARRGASRLAAQRCQAARVHAFGSQQGTFRAGLQFQAVAGLDAQGFEHAGRKRDLPLRRDGDAHDRTPPYRVDGL